MPNISLVTYAGQTVTPLDDALVYETAINQSGMIYGGTVTIKNANNLHISSGHGMVCGRKFTIFESDIQVALSSSGTLLGRLYVQLDLSNVGTPVQLLVETGASLTPVVQEKNVNIMNGVYEFNLATFTVDTSTISNIVNVAPSAEPSTGAGSVITITTSEASLQGKMCTITDGTTTLNANFDNTGTAIFYGVQMVGTVIVNATDGTYYASGQITITYFGKYSTSIAFWGATVNLSTTTPEFYGQTISITQDGILVGTTSFDGSGSATYIAPAVGTYIFTVTYGGNDYSATVNVASQTTYSATINQNNGLTLEAWITAGSTTDYPLNPSSYADFSALEADEAAVRQLMLVHDAVDYLAQATAGDSLMQSVINSDVCAKWINLSDYALDTLYANSDIASEMDTADKYFYGEWVENSGTWGAKGNVPIMTANNAPYGTAISDANYAETYQPYFVFMTNPQYGWLGPTTNEGTHYIGYKFVNPVCVRKVKIGTKLIGYSGNAVDSTVKLRYSNDGSTWTELDDSISIPAYTDTVADVENDVYALYWAIRFVSWNRTNPYNMNVCSSLQFYGRELTPLVPTMTSNTTPKGEAFDNPSNANTSFAAFKAFDGDGSTRWSSRGDATSAYLGYDFGEPMLIRGVEFVEQDTHNYTLTIKGSNDKSTWVDVGSPISVTGVANKKYNYSADGITKYRYWALFFTGITSGESLYTAQFYGMNYSEKEFAQGSTRKTIYDHGVELESIENQTYMTKKDYEIVSDCLNTDGKYGGIFTASKVNTSDYTHIRAIGGDEFKWNSATYVICTGLSTQKSNIDTNRVSYKYDAQSALPDNITSADISQMNDEYYIFISMSNPNTDRCSVNELWLE